MGLRTGENDSMGKHSAPEPERPRNSLVDTTLTSLKKILHLPVVEDKDREPSYGVGNDEVTREWLENNRNTALPFYATSQSVYENYDYVVTAPNEPDVSGWYAITPVAKGNEDVAAACILADYLDFNEVATELRAGYEIRVRRPGASEWQGFAEGRE